MKPTVIGAAAEIAGVATRHAEHRVNEHEHDLAQRRADGALEAALVDDALSTGDREALAIHATERTRQVAAAEETKRSKEQTKRMGIMVVAGAILGGTALVAGGAYYTIGRVTDAAQSLGDGLKQMFTEQEVSATQIQNTVTGFSLPGKTIVEEADLKGSIVVHTQGQFLGLQMGQGTDIPATVCGAEQVVADFQNPGVKVTAVKDAAGKGELVLQMPLDAITRQFVPSTVQQADGTLASACPDNAPTNGFFTKVGGSTQGQVAMYEQNNLVAACADPVRKLLDPGLKNAVRGTFKFGAMSQAAVASMEKQSPEEQAKSAYIRDLLPKMKIIVKYVTGDSGYTAADITNYRFGMPDAANKDQLAQALGEDPEHVTIPTQEETQCLMSAKAVNDYRAILNDPEQLGAVPTAAAGVTAQ